MPVNDIAAYASAFDEITPFRGHIEKGFLVDFLGLKTDANFRTMWGVDPETTGDAHIETSRPTMETSGEGWFEQVNWVEAAREARGAYVMMTLGACYGAQAVGSYLALQALNPMPATLVAVDAVPENIAWTRKHFSDNGIDPDDHWMVEAAMSANNEPVLFPVGSPGSGTQNCVSTNAPEFRRTLVEKVVEGRRSDDVLCNLLLANSTGVKVDLAPDSAYHFKAELRLVSAVTLLDLLGPFRRVDFVEADLQQSERLVFPPAMEVLSKKVRRVHLGTHGEDVHRQMHELFTAHGWEIVFSFAPDSSYDSPLGPFTLDDGILTALNPRVAYAS